MNHYQELGYKAKKVAVKGHVGAFTKETFIWFHTSLLDDSDWFYDSHDSKPPDTCPL